MTPFSTLKPTHLVEVEDFEEPKLVDMKNSPDDVEACVYSSRILRTQLARIAFSKYVYCSLKVRFRIGIAFCFESKTHSNFMTI